MPTLDDSGYKKLFSNKMFFRQLMENFVREDWVGEIDFHSCELLDKSFISDHYKKTESDIIYKAKLRQKDIYIVILIEFQSRVDFFMSVRILNYVTNFYMDYIESNKGVKRLPPVFPVMLYNGNRKWTAPEDIAALIEGNDLLGQYGLSYKYFKICENEFAPENLLKIRNLVSTLFLAEAHYDIELLRTEFLNLYDREEDKTAISLLLNWFLQLHRFGRIEEGDYKTLERVYSSKEEVKEMLITAIQKEKKALYNRGKRAGIKKGVKRGVERGVEKAKIDVAITLLRLGQGIEFVQKATSLPRETIEMLAKNLNN